MKKNKINKPMLQQQQQFVFCWVFFVGFFFVLFAVDKQDKNIFVLHAIRHFCQLSKQDIFTRRPFPSYCQHQPTIGKKDLVRMKTKKDDVCNWERIHNWKHI